MEIQNIAFVETGITLRMEIMRNAKENAQTYPNWIFKAGKDALESLVLLWCGLPRVLWADFHLSCLEGREHMRHMWFYYTGAIKTATLRITISFLNIQHRDDKWKAKFIFSSIQDGSNLEKPVEGILWLDNKKRLFLYTVGLLRAIFSQNRLRWRQPSYPVYPTEGEVVMQRAFHNYLERCGKIDIHNRKWKNWLDLEKKIGVKEWSFRFNWALLAIISVECLKIYSCGTKE